MQLDDLIAQVEDAAITPEPLDRLSAAMGVKADLDDLTDSLIGHFVDQARRAGCSWSEIGAAMGVTKQAAQQRHTAERPRREKPPWRFGQRWTDRARTVVREANGEALELGHPYVGTEHLLLGMLNVPQGIAGRILIEAGVRRAQVLAATAPAGERLRGRRHQPFTPLAKQALERALANALQLGHNYVGTEHQLLGVLDVPDGIAAKVLTDAGLTRDGVRAEVIERLRAVS